MGTGLAERARRGSHDVVAATRARCAMLSATLAQTSLTVSEHYDEHRS
jgi:hypothetical protein